MKDFNPHAGLLACLLFGFATLLAAGPAHAQDYWESWDSQPSWDPNRDSQSSWDQPSWDSQPSWQDQQELERLQDEIWDLEAQNRRLRALSAQQRNERWIDSSSGLYVPHRQR